MTVCKRIGAWLLTLVLLVSALPYTAFAASEDSHVVNAPMRTVILWRSLWWWMTPWPSLRLRPR